MPRVFVTTDHNAAPEAATVLLNEQVASVHLSTGHAASQLIERLAWAISDAEDAERAHRPARQPARVVAALVAAPAVASARGLAGSRDGSSRGDGPPQAARPARPGRRRGGAPQRRRAPAAA